MNSRPYKNVFKRLHDVCGSPEKRSNYDSFANHYKMLEIAIISFIKIRRPKGTSDSIYQCYFYLSTKNVVDCTHQACYRACLALAVYSRIKNIEVLAPLNIPSNSNRSSRISNKLFGFDSLHFHCVLSMCLCMSCPYIV